MTLRITALAPIDGYEGVFRADDRTVGYTGFIAVHSTALGPAVGGTRFWRYRSDAEALADVLRLARAMTYKSALAGLPFGGGKSVVLESELADRAALFRTHGRFVETLRGRYIAAEDVGTSPEDMAHIRSSTVHVAGLAERSGDPSPHTARGVFRAITAAAGYRWGSEDLSGRTVALQGCGAVGRLLAMELHRAGVRLIACDPNAARAARVSEELGARVVAPEAILDVDADIFAPCALGGVLDDGSIARLRVAIVAGAANNQLSFARHAAALAARGILYVPDYVANAGGIISGTREIAGWSAEEAHARIEAIRDTTLDLLRRAAEGGITPAEMADRIAEERFGVTAGARELPAAPGSALARTGG